MRNPRPYLLVALFSCFGFILGFVVCAAFFVPGTPRQVPPATGSQVDTQFLPVQRDSRESDEGASVTLVLPTFPPKVASTFDPLEAFAQELVATNR